MAFRAPSAQAVFGDEPARPRKRSRDAEAQDDLKLLRRCDALVGKWEAYEGERRARDRKGMRIFRGEVTGAAIGVENVKLDVSSMSPTAIIERVWEDVLRGVPEPEIQAVNPDEEDAALVAEGAIRTNWRRTRMREKIANAGRLSSFTRAVGFYHYWRYEMNGGIGDVDKRKIPGHRLIVDDRYEAIQDMKFSGFEEEMSRATLITLFPDKAEEIEDAADAAADRVTNIEQDPLRNRPSGGNAGGRVIDRLVTAHSTQTPPYKPITSIRTNAPKGKDPLSENVRVRFLWLDDSTPKRVKRARLDPRTKRPMYQLARDPITGAAQFDESGHRVVNTPLGPQYVPDRAPRFEIAMEDAIVRQYRYWRHVAYIVNDNVKLWDVAWDGPVPISILRDRLPAHGFDAPGTALRLDSLNRARDVLWTIIFQRLRKSLHGTYLAHANSGLKRNTLVNDIGAVFYTTMPINDAMKDFPVSPLDAAYFQLVNMLEAEMESLVGVTPMQKGQAAGRADSPLTYEQLADQSGGPILGRAKLVDQFIADATEIDLWFMQNYYTHRHIVEVELADGFATWQEASALAIRGSFAVHVETGATLGSNVARDRADAEHAAQTGFYALPMLGRVGRVKHWRRGLKQKGAIMAKGPAYSWLLGPSAASPAQQSQGIRAKTQRSHHRPGGK